MPTNLIDLTAHGYQILDRLGQNLQGGRATYKAIDLSTNAPVIITEFQHTDDSTENDRLQKQIKVLQKLKHPGIPKYLDSFKTQNIFYLVREYVEGKTILEDQTRRFPEEAGEILDPFVSILDYLQNQCPPIAPGDVQPENILINRESGQIYLVDLELYEVEDLQTDLVKAFLEGDDWRGAYLAEDSSYSNSPFNFFKIFTKRFTTKSRSIQRKISKIAQLLLQI